MSVVNKPEWLKTLETAGSELRFIHVSKANWNKVITWFAGARAVIVKHCPEQLSAFEKTMDVDFPKTTYAGAIPDRYELNRRQSDEDRRHDEIARNAFAALSKQFFTVLKMAQQEYENSKREEAKRKQQELVAPWKSPKVESEEVIKKQITPIISNAALPSVVLNKEVFIVHGHDEGMKEAVARFINKLGLSAKVLGEQPNKGNTLIEKFLDNSNVTFAIALLSPDDMAYPALSVRKTAKPRARQNVILELGYFIGKIGRERTCILKKGDIEIPSDYHGLVYYEFDNHDGWKMKLATELKSAGYEVDLNMLT